MAFCLKCGCNKLKKDALKRYVCRRCGPKAQPAAKGPEQ